MNACDRISNRVIATYYCFTITNLNVEKFLAVCHNLGMHRTSRFRTACRLTAALFIAVAAARLLLSALPLIDPLLATAQLACDPCGVRTDPVLLLEIGSEQRRAWQTPGTGERIVELIRTPSVRLMLFLAEVVRSLPIVILFLSLAVALRRLASGGFSLGAIRWLRRAALAAIVWTLSLPVSQSLRSTALSPVTSGMQTLNLHIRVGDLILPALLAIAVWICVWALEEAVTIRKDLDDYI